MVKKFKNSLFFKFLTSISLPVFIVAITFSVFLFFISRTLINDYVVPQFESKLETAAMGISQTLKLENLKLVSEGSSIASVALQRQLLSLKDQFQMDDVYIVATLKGEEKLVSTSNSSDKFLQEYNFSDDIHTAISKNAIHISEIYDTDKGSQISAYFPILSSNYILGVDIDATMLKEVSTWVTKFAIILTVIALLFSVILSALISKRTIKPIRTSLEYVNEVAAGKLNTPVFELKNNDEISQLSRGIFKMVDDLRQVIVQISENAEQVAATSQQLAANVEQTSQNIEEISSSIQSVAAETEQQTAAMQQTNAVVTTIASQFNEVTTITSDVVKQTTETSLIAKMGNESIHQAVEQMESTTTMIADTSKIVHQLSNSTAEIESIANLISAITEQTNLLALNASIEAARAGEHGKGFAVVADEVRKLADQSKAAATSIQQRIATITNEATLAVQSMSESYKNLQSSSVTFTQAGKSFEQIHTAVTALVNNIEHVEQSILDANKEIEYITVAVNKVNDSAQLNANAMQTVSNASEEQAASIEEIAASTNNLRHMAELLNESIQHFELETIEEVNEGQTEPIDQLDVDDSTTKELPVEEQKLS